MKEMQECTLGSVIKGLNEGRVNRADAVQVVRDHVEHSGDWAFTYDTPVKVPFGTIRPKVREPEAGG